MGTAAGRAHYARRRDPTDRTRDAGTAAGPDCADTPAPARLATPSADVASLNRHTLPDGRRVLAMFCSAAVAVGHSR